MAKKAAAKPAVAPKTENEKPPAAKPATKNEVLSALSETTGVEKKKVAAVMDALGQLVAKDLGKKGPGVFVIPGLVKLRVVRKPATKAKQGVNPFTKEPMTIKAKPARNAVRAVPLKGLKELV
jgi:nucleoid DNA-binding protein